MNKYNSYVICIKIIFQRLGAENMEKNIMEEEIVFAEEEMEIDDRMVYTIPRRS